MGKTFAYNTGERDDEQDDVINLQFGVFFDGTANNKFNTDLRGKVQENYSRQDEKFNQEQVLNERAGTKYKDYSSYDRFKVISEDSIRSTSATRDYKFESKEEKKGYEERGFQEAGTSYANDYTNVARMYDSSEKDDYAIYIEGIGTNKYQEDVAPGLGFGAQETGVKQRVWDAINLLLERIVRMKGVGNKTKLN